MKLHRIIATTVLTLGLSGGLALAQASSGQGQDKSAPAEAELIAKARAEYPLKTCLVSDEALGSMGDAVAHVHRTAGQPDRVVFVCCEGCIDDFKKEPAKFLKKVDAAAAKTKSEKGGKAKKSAS